MGPGVVVSGGPAYVQHSNVPVEERPQEPYYPYPNGLPGPAHAYAYEHGAPGV